MRKSHVVSFLAVLGLSVVWSVPLLAGSSERKQQLTREDVEREADETLHAVQQYTRQQKESFYRKMDEELTGLQRDIDKLKKKSDQASADARRQLQDAINDLDRRKNETQKKLKDMHTATSAAWGDLKAGMESSIKEMKQSVERGMSRFDERSQ